jgi:serine/threonine protein kinase
VSSARSKLARTTVVQAFARTIAAEDPEIRRSGADTPAAGSIPVFVSERSPEPPSSQPLPGVDDVVGGHYRLVRLLGEGMFGKVYVAQRLDVPEHQVALKLLPRSLYAGRNVERELVMLATVGHPHVVQLKDHGTTPDYVWLTMPVYFGETLAERLERGCLDVREAHDIFVPIARGLEALHAAGLRHQDVKPENLFLATFGGFTHPILLDLGVAAETDATFVAGTALYAAPEQVQVLSGLPAFTPLSEKMDTYGLAATLLMALVGPKRFPGETATDRSELAEAHDLRTKTPIDPDALPQVTGAPRQLIVEAFRKWLAFDPIERPSMKKLAEQLDVLLEPEREKEREEQRRRARQQATLQRFRVVFGAMLLIGLAGAAVMYTKRETIRVASALESARKEGQKSFGELGTCNAAVQQATKEAAQCKGAREKDRADFKQSLDEVGRSGSTSQAELAHQAQRYNNRLKVCADDAAAARRSCEEETARIVADDTRQRLALTKERDEARAAGEAQKATIASITAERDQCKAERASCAEERDACRAAARAAPGPAVAPGPRPPPAGSAAPNVPAVAPGTADPVAPPGPAAPVTAAPVTPPAPVPPPVPPPVKPAAPERVEPKEP